MVTSLEAAELFARKRHLGEISFIYFNVAQNRHFRYPCFLALAGNPIMQVGPPPSLLC